MSMSELFALLDYHRPPATVGDMPVEEVERLTALLEKAKSNG